MSTADRFVRWLTGDEEEGVGDRSTPAADASGQTRQRSTHLTGMPPVENNAHPYGVIIEEARIEPGTEYWRAVRVYHLGPHENHGRHHIFLDALSPQGSRVRNSRATISWDGGEQTVTLDKPDNEPGANFPMWKWQVCNVRMLGLASDVVHGLRTNHPDEPNPDGTQSGNTLFHHSFLVVFQKVTAPEEMGAIQGRVVNSRDGLTVELLRGGSVVETTALAVDGTFTFSVRPGEYEVCLEDQRQTVNVAGDQTVQVVFTLIPHSSVVEGVIHNGAGLVLRLVHQGDVLAAGNLGESGSFRLRNLAPGVYFVQVLRPGAIEPLVQSGPLELDGHNRRRVELHVPTSAEHGDEAFLEHYVLFGAADRPQTRTQLTLLAPVLAEERLTFGFDMHEAAQAKEVTVIGDGHAVSEFTLIYLATRGLKVQRLTGTPQEISAHLRG